MSLHRVGVWEEVLRFATNQNLKWGRISFPMEGNEVLFPVGGRECWRDRSNRCLLWAENQKYLVPYMFMSLSFRLYPYLYLLLYKYVSICAYVYANVCHYVFLQTSISLPVSKTFDYVSLCIFTDVYMSYLLHNTLKYVSVKDDPLCNVATG